MTEDEQYKTATKAVDDAMRTDTLGPNLKKTLESYKPANDYVKDIVAEAISSHPATRANLTAFISSDQSVRRNKWLERVGGFVFGAIVVALIQWAFNQLGK